MASFVAITFFVAFFELISHIFPLCTCAGRLGSAGCVICSLPGWRPGGGNKVGQAFCKAERKESCKTKIKKENFQTENLDLVPSTSGRAPKPGLAGEADQEETARGDQVGQKKSFFLYFILFVDQVGQKIFFIYQLVC